MYYHYYYYYHHTHTYHMFLIVSYTAPQHLWSKDVRNTAGRRSGDCPRDEGRCHKTCLHTFMCLMLFIVHEPFIIIIIIIHIHIILINIIIGTPIKTIHVLRRLPGSYSTCTMILLSLSLYVYIYI